MTGKTQSRPRRSTEPAFKLQAVKMIREQGQHFHRDDLAALNVGPDGRTRLVSAQKPTNGSHLPAGQRERFALDGRAQPLAAGPRAMAGWRASSMKART